MIERKNILKEASVLLIITTIMLSSIVVTANTNYNINPEIIKGKNYKIDEIVYTNTLKGPVVWDNGMNFDIGLAAQFDPDYPYDAFPADDFHFEEDTEVCDVHWISYDQMGVEYRWCIAFYYDDGTGGAPGVLWINFCFEYEEITVTHLGESYYEMSVDLPINLLFEGCHKYWVSIFANGPYPPQLFWAMHEIPIILHMAVFKSNYFGFPHWTDIEIATGTAYDMCFQLTQKNINPNPPVFYDPPRVIPVNEPWEFDIASIDPDGHRIQYHIDWGDGIPLESDFYESGEIITFNHIWNDQGIYTVKAKAVDIFGAESNWSYIELEVPRNRAIQMTFLRFLNRFSNTFPILKQLLSL